LGWDTKPEVLRIPGVATSQACWAFVGADGKYCYKISSAENCALCMAQKY
jgi:hypothetical protein